MPLDLLGVMTGVWSNHSSDVDVESLASLVCKCVASSAIGSDGLSSSVESEPLLLIIWVKVLNSESELVSTNVLVPEEGSSFSHSASDLELDSACQWLLWIFDAS